VNAPASFPESPTPPDPRIVRVLAPDARRLSSADVRRMLGGLRPHHARGGGLERGRQMVAVRGDEPVGVAAFEMDEGDLFVHVLAVPEGDRDGVVPALLGALELACLAAGGRRVAVTAHADVDPGTLAALGYDAGSGRPGWLARCLV
jgi:hypothetical protein